jgi:hypothetical protein
MLARAKENTAAKMEEQIKRLPVIYACHNDISFRELLT